MLRKACFKHSFSIKVTAWLDITISKDVLMLWYFHKTWNHVTVLIHNHLQHIRFSITEHKKTRFGIVKNLVNIDLKVYLDVKNITTILDKRF